MLSRLRNLPPLFRRFHDGIGISFWDHYKGGHGTAVRCYRCHPGLIGIKLVRWDGRCIQDVRAVQLGLWWTIELSLCAVPLNRFVPQNKPATTK